MSFEAETAFKEISKGNTEAYRFLCCLYGWVHCLDDLIDQDRPILLDAVLEAHFNLILTLSENGFYQKNKQTILPILLASSLAYRESERFSKHEKVLYRIGSQVWKSSYQDVFYVVAYLIGGYGHATEMSKKFRGMDFDPVSPFVSS